MLAKRRKAHKKDTVASVSVNCQKLAAHWEKARAIMGKEDDNVSHVTELHVINKGYFSEAFLFKPRGGRSAPSGLNIKPRKYPLFCL